MRKKDASSRPRRGAWGCVRPWGYEKQWLKRGKLVAVVIEKLDAVVVIRIVRGGDDNAGIGAQAVGDPSHAGRGQRADEKHIHSHRQDAAG